MAGASAGGAVGGAPDAERQIDLLDGDLYAGDPTPTYAWLRRNAPVYRDAGNALWGVSRYADVVAVEKNPAVFSNRNAYRPVTVHDPGADSSMINFDDPRHHAQRSLVSRRFTPRAAGSHSDTIRSRVVSLIDEVVDRGGCEVVESLAAPLPAMMIAEALGFGVDRWPEVKGWSERTIGLGGGDRYMNDDGIEAAFEFAAACQELINLRRREPATDMVSHWCNSEVEGRPMTDEEIISECLLLVDGGAETTRTVIASVIWELCEHPDQLALLRDDPTLLSTTAVEEFIRYVTPILNMARVVTADATVGAQRVAPGDRLLLMYGSANRDETVFADPERFDVTRTHNHHVAFGFGTHFCLGASLARLEIRIFFEEMLARTTDWSLDPQDQPERIPGAFVRGVRRVPLRFRAA